MAYISKITIPGGSTYDIKDASARQDISTLFQIINQGALDLVVVNALQDASAGTKGKIYLVPDSTHDPGVNDIYDEYVTVQTGSGDSATYAWEKIGNTDVNLSGYSLKTHTHGYSGTTDSSGAHTHTIGAATKKYLQAQANVPLTFTTKKFVSATSSSKLTTTTVIGVSTGTASASKATAGTAVNVAKPGTETQYSKITGNTTGSVTITPTNASTATGTLGNETATRGADTPMWGASVNDSTETLSFTFKPLTKANRLTAVSASTDATKTVYSNSSITGINGSVSYTPYTFSNVTVPIKNDNATTVATGGASTGSSGASVLVGATLDTSAYTGLDTSVSLLKNVAPSTTTTNVQVVTGVVTTTGSAGSHAHTYSGTTTADNS